jgi:hypothetical protein
MVPSEYYWNKILFGAAWGLIGFYALKYWWVVRSPRTMAFAVPAVIAASLQTKYFYQGWDLLSFVLLFMVFHYLMFLPFSFYIFKRYRHIFFDIQAAALPPIDISHKKLRRIGLILTVLLIEALAYMYFVRIEGLSR